MTPDIDRRDLTGWQEIGRQVRLLVGDVVVDALNRATPWLFGFGAACAAFWWLA